MKTKIPPEIPPEFHGTYLRAIQDADVRDQEFNDIYRQGFSDALAKVREERMKGKKVGK